MTTYKKYSIKNRKTRKIKLFNGGAYPEDDIIKVAIDKVNESVSPKKGGIDDSIKNTAIEKVKESLTVKPGGKQVSILIDFYKKLLKPEDYGNKLDNFNKFYENVNINKNGINMTESITGVEELLKIFNNELEYMKATDAEKDAKKKALSENHTKRKAVIIDYGDNGDFTINGDKGAVVPAEKGPAPGVAPGTAPEDSIKETAKNTVVSNINTINTIQDAAINELKLQTALFISVEDLKELHKSIKDAETKLNPLNLQLTYAKNDLKREQRNLETAQRNLETAQRNIETAQNIKKQKEISTEIGSIKTKIKKHDKNIKDINEKIKKIEIDNLLNNKNNLLKLLQETLKNLIEKLKNSDIEEGKIIGYTIKDNLLKDNISKIEEKIKILQ